MLDVKKMHKNLQVSYLCKYQVTAQSIQKENEFQFQYSPPPLTLSQNSLFFLPWCLAKKTDIDFFFIIFSTKHTHTHVHNRVWNSPNTYLRYTGTNHVHRSGT